YMAVEDIIGVGYTVETFIIPACGVNAPHRRDRVWIVAHSEGFNDRGTEREFYQKDGRQDGQMLSAPGRASDGLCEDWSSGHPDSESTGRYNTRDWRNFPTQPPLRVGNDGLSSNMVRSAIRGAGNAIVPQIAFEIFKAIEQVR